MFHLYTDGACQPNPGKGGWAFILRNPKKEVVDSRKGYEPFTTNNRMEMTAALEGIKHFKTRFWKKNNQSLQIYSDSQYIINGMKDWLKRWEENNWKRKDKKEVLNADLWQEIAKARENIQITYKHIKGHSGHPDNEECDAMAVSVIQKHK